MFRAPLLLLALALALTSAGFADTPRHDEQGRYDLRLGGRSIGFEEYALDLKGDSLVVDAHSRQSLPGRGANGTAFVINKTMTVVTDAFDFGLRRYTSSQITARDTLIRGVEPTASDTVFSVYRQLGDYGVGDRLVLPPGRLFVVDSPPMFSTFGLICRTLKDKAFDHRPLSLFVLGPRDTLLEATVSDLGRETITWAARPVSARKLRFSDGSSELLAWVSPAGQMLRFEQPSSGLRVERVAPAPAVRRATKRRAG